MFVKCTAAKYTCQGRRKECKIGPTIWKEPQSDNYWSDQNSENTRLWPWMTRFLVRPRSERSDQLRRPCMPVHQQYKSFVWIRFSWWSSIERKLATKLFPVVLPASGLISLQQSIIESNKLNFMMKYHLDFLFELATCNNNWDVAIFVQPGWVMFCWSHFYSHPRP